MPGKDLSAYGRESNLSEKKRKDGGEV